MAALIFTSAKEYNISCELRNADHILTILKRHNATFVTKYTTLHEKIPSTITFVGVTVNGPTEKMAAIFHDIYDFVKLNSDDDVGNVYISTTAHTKHSSK